MFGMLCCKLMIEYRSLRLSFLQLRFLHLRESARWSIFRNVKHTFQLVMCVTGTTSSYSCTVHRQLEGSSHHPWYGGEGDGTLVHVSGWGTDGQSLLQHGS